MFDSIKGILKEKDPTRTVVETNGIGYRLMVSLSTSSRLPNLEDTVHLHLLQVVREDSNTLYAFLEKQERDFFEVLISVSGIGPKTALGIIGHMDISTLQSAIANQDTRILSTLPGIGKKTAERLVLEMRDKIKKLYKKGMPLPVPSGDPLVSDAVAALMNLGYNPLQAQQAVQSVGKEATDLSSLITLALKKI